MIHETENPQEAKRVSTQKRMNAWILTWTYMIVSVLIKNDIHSLTLYIIRTSFYDFAADDIERGKFMAKQYLLVQMSMLDWECNIVALVQMHFERNARRSNDQQVISVNSPSETYVHDGMHDLIQQLRTVSPKISQQFHTYVGTCRMITLQDWKGIMNNYSDILR